MKKILVVLLLIIATVVVLPLAYNNAQPIDFNYFFGVYQLPLSWLIIAAFSLGVLLSLIFFAFTGLVWKFRAKRLSKQIDELLKERKRSEIADNFKKDNSEEK